jgi:hypothetical protein
MLVLTLDWSDEIAKASITLAFAAVLSGAVGTLWGLVRHRRELDLAALGRFYETYGTWFAIWKAWSDLNNGEYPADERGELLAQAAVAEGQFEALLVKLAIERRLSEAQIERLGRFREGYQQLRESIEQGVELPFRVQFNDDERNAYVAFKALSVEFAALLGRRRGTVRSQRRLVAITSWRVTGDNKQRWWRNPGSNSVRQALEADHRLRALRVLSARKRCGPRARFTQSGSATTPTAQP